MSKMYAARDKDNVEIDKKKKKHKTRTYSVNYKHKVTICIFAVRLSTFSRITNYNPPKPY